MCSSAKSSKAQQTAAQQAQEAEIRAGEEVRAASEKAKQELISQGKLARQEMTAAGLATPEESDRLARAKGKATTPGEALLQEAGPISQAVARRIQERVNQPGLDYQENLPAFTEGVTLPLWRVLKSRGIVAPPGAEGGGGLATQQYMKGAAPALAELRANQISSDITRGQQYGETATELSKYYQELERSLGEALRQRQYEAGIRGAEAEQRGVEAGSPYGVSGVEAAGQGRTAAAAINQAEVQSRYAKKEEDKAAIGKMVAMIVLGAISGGSGAGVLGLSAGAGAMAGAAGGRMSAMGGKGSTQPLALKRRLVSNV